MKPILLITAAEWRYWLHSRIAIGAIMLFIALFVLTSFLVGQGIYEQSAIRNQQQTQAEATFLAQPDRHPHRMVHYGHYVFRAPAPLAMFDPGLDPVTGQSIFLEGHRQNSAMFAEFGASANLGGLAWLTPAIIYQLFAPLIIILLGHTAIVREREAGTLSALLAQGLDGHVLMIGKSLALLGLSTLLMMPLIFTACFALAQGESIVTILSLIGVYFLYLCVWSLLAVIVSAIVHKRAIILAVLTALWIILTLLLPSTLVDITTQSLAVVSKIENDLELRKDLRNLGDGHNANDPAFQKLRADLLKQYDVQRIEDLPVNFRGLVASNSEEKTTEVLNRYAEARMADEARQARLLLRYAWTSPVLALANASRALSATDLEHYHRFLREAEDIRFKFVQGLNHAHIHKLTYQDDINRSRDEKSNLQARVDASNWQVLETFSFKPADTSLRLAQAFQPVLILLVWFALLLGSVCLIGSRVTL